MGRHSLPLSVEEIVRDNESERLELKSSLDAPTDREDVREAICAFANDYPASGKPGFAIVGIRRNLEPSGTAITEELLRQLADFRFDGTISPPISMSVERRDYRKHSVAVVTVLPAPIPPIRCRGRTCIRIGSRRDYASFEEERRLLERAPLGALPFDRQPCPEATLSDVLVDQIRAEYLPQAIRREILESDRRPPEEWMSSLRFFDLRRSLPTYASILLFGREPRQYVPGAYVQVVRFAGPTQASEVLDEKEITGNIATQLRQLEELLPIYIESPRTPTSPMRALTRPIFPVGALRELVVNAVVHRAYDGTAAPISIRWFSDRLEISNPGGLYGQVNASNFGSVADYRNPTLADALKVLGYIDRFGNGISKVADQLSANGNPAAEYALNEKTHFSVTVRRSE